LTREVVQPKIAIRHEEEEEPATRGVGKEATFP
jgi:hypothetical protein